MTETIVCAAIEHEGEVHTLPAPRRHHDILLSALEYDASGPSVIARSRLASGRQGFLTSNGRFVSREEARSIAILSGQCPRPMHSEQLFTEDLW